MNKQDIENLIDRLAGKDNPCNCECGCGNCCCWKNPILIGDVLERMRLSDNIELAKEEKGTKQLLFADTRIVYGSEGHPCYNWGLITLWAECGLTKSLQQINEDGWEEIVIKKCAGVGKCPSWGGEQECKSAVTKNQLKPEALALFKFINETL